MVFEEHLPECTPLYDVKVKRGSKVCKKNGKVNDIFLVQNKNGSKCNLPFIIVEIKCKKEAKDEAQQIIKKCPATLPWYKNTAKKILAEF